LIEKLNFHEQFCENGMASTPREFTSQTLMLMVTRWLPSVVLQEMCPGFSRKQKAED
jgi:hypothetical protein